MAISARMTRMHGAGDGMQNIPTWAAVTAPIPVPP